MPFLQKPVFRLLLGGALLGGCGSPQHDWAVVEPLADGQDYVWHLRAEHAGELWIPVGDSLQVVLLRDRCGIPVGHGMRGCRLEPGTTARVRWTSADRSAISVRALPAGNWLFGRALAGARLYGHREGQAILIAHLPQGTLAETVTVLPRFERLRIEPRDSTYVVGDTTWFRTLGVGRDGRVVATLPLPLSIGTVVGEPRADGAIPIRFDYPTHESVPTRDMEFVIGSKRDTLRFRVLARPDSS